MKLRLAILPVMLAFATILARADDYEFTDSVSRSGAFSPTGEITLENVNGNVDIRTWDKNEILIEGEKSAKTEEELQLIDLRIDLSETSAVIRVKLPKRPGSLFSGGNIRAGVRFKLTVPASAALRKISTVNSNLTIDGVRGPVNASTVNGVMRATGLGGAVDLETVNGSIKASFATVAAQQRLSFKTVNGQVVVSLPRDAGLQMHSSVVNGRVTCDFPLEPEPKKRSRSLSGKIGDGRASLEAETVNGSIHLESQ